ncbi:unnamed protein product [Pieris brassicae]|uniref:Uncharacterized protein n=1 Tax=Pieris brassicae TaxID=7116 RepID=A0A9P0TMI0_PIEBR|nr:unnamed protein product [Pieris brassicae]
MRFASLQKCREKPQENDELTKGQVISQFSLIFLLDLNGMRIINKKRNSPAAIVDCFYKIIMEDDEPQPMKNYKPAQKTKNGADKFWDTHQEYYEARGKRSNDRVGRVNKHNTAHPKLRDELRKRRSTAKVTTSNTRTSRNYTYRKRQSKTQYKRRTPIYKPIRKWGTNFRTIGSQCAYVLVKNKNVGADGGILKIDNKLNTDCAMRAKWPQTSSSGASKPQSKSGASLKNPDTSIATLSSFNSHESLDQEPMV